MGTDIHLVVQRRSDQNSPWEFVDIPVQDEYGYILDERNYDAFAILANVRNGYGFAGISTGSGFVPISDQRGLPKDFPNLVHDDYVPVPSSAENSKSFEDNSDLIWLGDHSRTWVTLRELQEYDWDAVVIKRDRHLVKVRDVVPSLVDVVIPRLASLGGPDNVRIVMGFDS